MARRGWGRGLRRAVPVVVGVVLVAGTACSADLDRARTLDTTLAGVRGVTDAAVRSATEDRATLVEVTLDLDLDATQTLATLDRVDAAAREAGYTPYVLEVSRTITAGDVLSVDDTFVASRAAGRVVQNWIRVLDALLGDVTYEYGPGHESIEVVSGGGIAHDVAEAARIGYGDAGTTWRFLADSSEFVVSARVTRRDVHLFNRVQRTVVSTVLPVPATHWELQRRTGHLLLDLEVSLDGKPEQVTIERWGPSVRPLAEAAVGATRYPALPRFLQLSDVTSDRRDTFAVWSSQETPVRGRDRWSRGWDLWWVRLERRLPQGS